MPYDTELVNAFRIDRALLRWRAGDSGPLPGLLYMAARMLGAKTIVDFGGGTGDHGLAMTAALPVSYTVVETPAMVRLAKQKLERSRVEFSDETAAPCDVFFTSGTLQCLAHPYEMAETAFRTALKAVVFARNSFSAREIVRVHRTHLYSNGVGPIPPGYKNVRLHYPHRTIIEKRLHDIAAHHGFRCIASVSDTDGVLPYGGRAYGRQLVFTRI